ncbi:hypothetical protein RchiOBHm_Chr5g0081781 [Rosa chinensis]|uniref:Uncharacterized protein n=1 Tax=Rosa chinensis TaxID=74649 RepID=A0A2P6QN63_ROSCH|nr:hypothetical protein RchiOBHm_Chr5g0081781 [Rosa chinensis]
MQPYTCSLSFSFSGRTLTFLLYLFSLALLRLFYCSVFLFFLLSSMYFSALPLLRISVMLSLFLLLSSLRCKPSFIDLMISWS